jgi:hypothetical protein
MEPKTFSLSVSQSNTVTWGTYLSIPVLVVYVYFLIESYVQSGWDSDLTFDVLVFTTYAILIYNAFRSGSPQKEICLSQNSIEISSDNERQHIKWSDLSAITLDHNTILLDFFNKSQREVDIDYIEYKELQELKKTLRSLCNRHSVTFSPRN